MARSKSIAVSTMRLQEGRSVTRRNAECSPGLSGLRSLSIVRSQDWRGRPLWRRQSTGRRSVDARSAHEWSSEAPARDICPNSLRRRCCISEETGGWLVCERTYTLVTCAVYGTRKIRRLSTIGQKHQVVSTLLSHSMCPSHIGAPEEYM